MKTPTTFLALMLFAVPTLHAQIVNDGATNTLSIVTTNITGDVTVGTNGSFTLLVLSNNALLTNSVRGLIGRNATAKSNEVRLVSASARWRMGNNLFVGSNGAFSRLVVSNGALVENFDGILANGIASSNNVALVTGGGSIWSNRGDLTVGFSGRENQLIVSNGGRVANRFGYLGRQPGSSSNVARVTGNGSVWSNQFDLAVGANDRSNRLIIEAGGVVSCANGVVSGSSSSGNNEVLVTGPGSLWSNRFFLFMGDVAGRNRLVVSNGANVWSGGGIMGTLSPAISNQVIVTGSGSVWTNESSLSLGESSSGNRVDVSDGGKLACLDGAVGLNAGANNNTVLLTGAGSTWNNLANLMVGNSGSGNVLITSNGATVLANNLFVGFNNSAISNSATVTGPGTSWLIASNLFVGSNSAFNLLIISNGAAVVNNTGLISGGSPGASNRVVVTDAGSIWNNRIGLVIGNQSGGSRLVVSNGGVVLNGFGSMGVNASSNNSVQVTGTGSVWSNALLLRIGNFGVGNRVVIENGARLDSEDASVGAFSANNEAVITGAGSLWSNRDQLSVGGAGSGNRLVISNAAVASTVNALIVGEFTASTNNRVVVDGGTLRVTNVSGTGLLDVRRGTTSLNAGLIDVQQLRLTNALGLFDFNGGTLITRGAFVNNGSAFVVGYGATNPAVWDVRAGASNVLTSDLYVGYYASFGQLLITNGALLSGLDGFVGSKMGANSNAVLLSGSGSKWAAGYLNVGDAGAFNRLIVSNGATAEDFNGVIGKNASSSNNLAVVTGTGSLWTNRNEMYVGESGSGNQLVVSNGGTAFAQFTRFLGHASGATSNNTAIVTGAGSRWVGPGNLEVGGPAAFCRLLVNDGGRVENNSGFIGSGSSASNNLVVVAGAGSVWTNANSLFVGNAGAGNQLVVSNGAAVFGYEGVIGYTSSSSNNLAMVTGAGSIWSNAVDLFVGNDGRNNQLIVSAGGIVRGPYGTVGLNASSSNNLAMVTGAGSIWSNGGALYVGGNGMGNRLVVSNGGFVAAADATIGAGPNSANNEVVISGPGSVYSNAVSINVNLGENGSSNRMRIEEGGLLVANVLVGYGTTSTGNVLTVTGPGSRLFVPRDDIEIFVGGNGPGNLLIVSNGAAVLGDGGAIGYNATSRNNLAVVTGAGSVWSNQNVLQVGRFGPNNRLLITDGGTVSSTNAVNLGFQITTSSNNLLHVANGTLRVQNMAGTGTLDIRSGTNRFDSGLIDLNRLLMTNAQSRFEFNGGTLITRGAVISNGVPFTVGGPGGTPAVWDLRAGAINHVVANASLRVGGDTSFNRLLVTNGASLTGSDDFIGFNSTASSNSAIVAGAGSRWAMGDFAVGWSGSLNSLVTSNGGRVVAAGFIQIGANAGSSNNLALVTGLGSELSTTNDDFYVGYSGAGNRLVVDNGGVMRDWDGSLGGNTFSSYNQALVTGPGSLWTNSDEMYVGESGSGNQLVVSNGATVADSNGVIGANASASNNLALVTGLGSMWSNAGELFVGDSGSGNSLIVTNGGTVFAFANKYVGYNDGAISNTAIVTDPGSRWLGDDSLYVGSAGSFNRLFVRNGAQVVSGIGTLGGILGANSNQVLVTDAGTVWTNQLDLNVGEGGSANQMVVSNGGAIFSASDGFIGRNSGANSNAAILTDVGTRWLIASNLHVGSSGAFSLLVISNGARVQSDFAAISAGLTSSNNEVLISGAGSIWSNRNELHVGRLGRGNSLVVVNGGRVDCPNAQVGLNASASNNQAIVTGAGSFWRVQTSLIIGNSSGGNRLVVSNGASLFDDGVTIGLSGTNNEALVTGAGATWTNRIAISVGTLRGHNQLVISNGAFVLAGDVFVSLNPASTNNRVVMHGGTLLVTNTTGGVGALDVRRGTNVLNAGLIDVARLLVTNALGDFEFNGGTLVSSGTTIGNGRVFTVGDGASAATFTLRSGTHSFANNLVVASNAFLLGNGTILGTPTIQPGGTLAPGVSIGKLVFSNSPVLQGVTIMELNKNGATLTHDQIQAAGPLTFGGSLVVTNIGPTALAIGDRFPLFSASSFGGAFSSITLPPLPYTLTWTNKLATDGSLEVAAYVPPPVTLTIQHSNGFVTLTWPTNGSDYCLETTFDLTPPVAWQTVTSSVTTNGPSFVLSLPHNPAVPKQFFRLAFPCSPAPVTLSIQISNNLVTLHWPSNAFRLETSFNLPPPVSWQTVSNGISDSGSLRTFTFTNSPAVTNQFFRLALP